MVEVPALGQTIGRLSQTSSELGVYPLSDSDPFGFQRRVAASLSITDALESDDLNVEIVRQYLLVRIGQVDRAVRQIVYH